MIVKAMKTTKNGKCSIDRSCLQAARAEERNEKAFVNVDQHFCSLLPINLGLAIIRQTTSNNRRVDLNSGLSK